MLSFSAIFCQTPNPIIVEKNARFTIITPACIRLEYSASGKFVDEPSLFAVCRDARTQEFSVQHHNNHEIVIKTEKIALTYRPNGQPFCAENLHAIIYRTRGTTREEVAWNPGMPNQNNLGGTVRTLDQARGKFPLDDGVLSRDGWYLHDDSHRHLLVNGWVQERLSDYGTDWYLFGYGLDYKAGLKALAAIAGPVPLPRKYLLGSWYSRYWPYTSKEYREIVEEYHQNNFPLDIMVMDMDWHRDGWTGWSWNRTLLPDAEDLLAWFHQQGLAVTLNLHPADGVKPHEDAYLAFMKDMGVAVNTESGADQSQHPVLPFDPSNQKYMDMLFKHTHTPMEKLGVDFWWLDWQQHEFTVGSPQLRNLEWLNHCYFQHTSKENLRGASFSRWGGWGDHRHPIHFSGDAVSIWPMLEFEVPFTSIAGNIGCFFWSHDIGGHFGGLNPETNARWVQFGAMSAALRLHSTRDENMDKRPWTMKEAKYIESMRVAFHIRSRWMPYIYSSAAQSCQNTIPLTRQMYIDYPEKEIAYRCPQQYLLGDAVLVAPITEPGTGHKKIARQHVWFPEGNWYNWFTGELEKGEGDQVRSVWANIAEFPLYVKGGIPIPMQPYTERMAMTPLTHLVVRVHPGDPGQFVLYEDDGITKEYQQGKFATTQLRYETQQNKNGHQTHSLIIEPTQGTYQGQPQQRAYTIEFAQFVPIENAIMQVQGKNVEFESGWIQRVQVPAMPIQQRLEVKLILPTVSQQLDFAQSQQMINLAAQLQRMGAVAGFINESKKQNKPVSAYHTEHFYSIMSGVSWFKESEQQAYLCIVRPQDSPIKIQLRDCIGRQIRVLQEYTLSPQSVGMSISTQEPLPSCFGVPVKREVVATYQFHDGPVSLTKVLDAREPYLPECLLLGPFAFDRNKDIKDYVHAPELQDLTTLLGEYCDRENKPISWIKATAQPDAIIDIRKQFDCDDAICYALVYLQSDVEQPVQLELNSDDGIEVWLNRKKIHSNNAFRAVFHDPDIANGTLKAGKNVLLVKISQGMGGWCFKVKVLADKPLRYSLEY